MTLKRIISKWKTFTLIIWECWQLAGFEHQWRRAVLTAKSMHRVTNKKYYVFLNDGTPCVLTTKQAKRLVRFKRKCDHIDACTLSIECLYEVPEPSKDTQY